VIINCAAYTNVDGAESHASLAHLVNAEAVGRLGKLAAERGTRVLHISTDFVFDGELDRPYVETDVATPVNEYGRSKLAGEQLLAESGCSHCIVRLEWTYGIHGTNFVTKLIRRAQDCGRLQVVDDQVGSPTATTVVAGAICELIEQKAEGIFHLAGAGYVSRFGIAQFVVERLGLDVEVQPCHSDTYPMPARRPLNSRFDCSKIQAILNDPLEPWQGPLGHFLRQLDEDDSGYGRCRVHRQQLR
jgi:dTDP-4-dehydrorhamnose reductase